MDIFNQTPTVSEDTLQYALYPPAEQSDKDSVTTLAACVQTFVDSTLPPEFLWHRDSFEVKVVQDQVNKGWMIEGRMRVGDCVDDEWCTVWLLREISSKWDIAISVFDSDGEFLLIEAADALPAWVKPTNSENRVWIYKSHLHLIDVSHVSPPFRNHRRRTVAGHDSDNEDSQVLDETDEFLAVDDALKLLRDPLADTLAPRKVEEIVWDRIAEYPAGVRSHVHFTKSYLPFDIAKALSVNPFLIQKAVEAFYTRDAIQLRSAHRMSRFPPHTAVLTTVKMTRTAYAQLVGQKFFPPKIFGRWPEKESSKEWRWRDIGMKIAVGFEILFQESKGRSETNSSAEGLKSSAEARKDILRRNPDYSTYIQNLTATGYFKGEMQGSQLWNELEDKAAEIFSNIRKEDSSTRPSFATLVMSAISQAQTENPITSQDEDSDDWLNIDAESFENMLEQTRTKAAAKDSEAMDVDESDDHISPEDRAASSQASRLRELASKVEEFVEGEGDIEGAQFADEMFSDEDFDDDSDNEQEEAERKQVAMDNLVPKLDPSEYGKMPASFHSNSQRVASAAMETNVLEEMVDQKGDIETPHLGRRIREPILPRDKFDGVDSDDETDEDENDDPESEEDQPQVVGDIEVDMGEEEEEFLEFSRQALGISDAQWNDILRDRIDRGAFVPKNTPSMKMPTVEIPSGNAHAGEKPVRTPAAGPRPNVNPNLDSFEAVMKAMDAELSHSRRPVKASNTSSGTEKNKEKGKGKAKVTFQDEDEVEDEIEDIEAAMEAELKAALERGDEAEDGELGDANIDYNLIKNFLESFKSQAGLSGPVSNLAGRLQPEWKLPRDG